MKIKVVDNTRELRNVYLGYRQNEIIINPLQRHDIFLISLAILKGRVSWLWAKQSGGDQWSFSTPSPDVKPLKQSV